MKTLFSVWEDCAVIALDLAEADNIGHLHLSFISFKESFCDEEIRCSRVLGSWLVLR
jgi:hypothetical protein